MSLAYLLADLLLLELCVTPGEPAVPEILRTRVGAEGETSVVGEVKLSHFFG